MKSKSSFILKAALSLALAFVLLFSTMTVGFSAIVKGSATTGGNADLASTGDNFSSGSKIYFVPNSNWLQVANDNNPRFAAYFFTDGVGAAWVSMSQADYTSSSEHVFQCTVPEDYAKVIFCRMKGWTTENNWDNKYNQTGNLSPQTDKNKFTLPDGSWDGAGDGESGANWSNHVLYTTTLYVKKTLYTIDGKNHAYIAGNNGTNVWSWPGEDMTTSDQWDGLTNPDYYIRSFTTPWSTFEVILNNGNSGEGNQTTDSNTVDNGGSYHIDTITNYAPVIVSGVPYTVSYNPGSVPTGGGEITGTTPDSQTKIKDVALTLSTNAFSSDGYTQNGWSLTDGGSQAIVSGGSYTTNAPQVFYPAWSEVLHNATLAATSNGNTKVNSGVANTASKPINNIGVATSATITAEPASGYAFNGWTSSDPTHTVFDNDKALTTTVNVSADSVTITANFIPNTHPVYAAALLDTTGSAYTTPPVGFSPTIGGNTPAATIGNTINLTSSVESGYTFVGWYASDSALTTLSASTEPTVTTQNHTIASVAADTPNYWYALYRKQYTASAYLSYVWDTTADYTGVGTDNNSKGGDAILKSGTPSHVTILNADGSTKTAKAAYTGGADVVVDAGEKVVFTYSGLSASDLITELHRDNSASFEIGKPVSSNFNINATGTNLWYSGNSSQTVTDLTGIYDVTENTITLTMTEDYKNLTLVLGTKPKITINGGDWDGLTVTGLSDGGYYTNGATVSGVTITLSNPVATEHNVWTGTTATVTGGAGITATGYQSDGNSAATSTSDLNQFKISGTMPSTDVEITIPVEKQYTMRFSNVMIDDRIGNKSFLTQTDGTDVGTDNSSAKADASGHVGTITAEVKNGSSTVAANIAQDSNDHWYYSGTNTICEDNDYSSNYYLKGGVNKTGTAVTAGNTVTYTFTFAAGKAANYSFIGWFSGTYSDGTFTPNYNDKLSSKEEFTYTPKKDTVVIAVGTRDMYIGGTFDSDGTFYAESDTTHNTILSNRIVMDYDASYVHPSDSSKKGRYYHTFENVVLNQEYSFRCYDSVNSANITEDQTIWDQWGNDVDEVEYTSPNADVTIGRYKFTGDTYSSTGHFTFSTGNKNNGYIGNVTVYFYAYDGGISAEAEMVRRKAYVSEGVGIYVTNASAVIGGSGAIFNDPELVSVTGTGVVPKTTKVEEEDVVTQDTYGSEKILECTINEKNPTLTVTVNSGHTDVELQGFVVYYLSTKHAISVETVTPGSSNQYSANIPFDSSQKSDVYICPVYKFTDNYIKTATVGSDSMEEHDVTIYTSDLGSSTWGGLAAMYSWGTTTGFSSGNWPGQLLLPKTASDGSTYFTGKLQFIKNNLAGVTINNYFDNNFLSNHCNDGSYVTGNKKVQSYDYREPISIVQNLSNGIYTDMDLTFRLKGGNKYSDKTGYGDYADASSWEYLTNRNGTKYVDLNGNEMDTKPLASYKIVCRYTTAYSLPGNYSFDSSTKADHFIQWYVYDSSGTYICDNLSAAYADKYNDGSMLSVIAKQLTELDKPVTERSVQIAYENPSYFDEGTIVRYSGQWYCDSANTPISASVKVAVKSGDDILVGSTNDDGYGRATVSISSIASPKSFETCTAEHSKGNSKATVTVANASKGKVQFSVDTTENFVGWYNEAGQMVGSGATFAPSFNTDNTVFYAVYSATATYKLNYTARDGSTKTFITKGIDLLPCELSAGCVINLTNETRSADIEAKLAKHSSIKVFNKDVSFSFATANSNANCTVVFNATEPASTYNLKVYNYSGVGNTLALYGTISGNFNDTIDLTANTFNGKKSSGASLVTDKPSSGDVFIGWVKYDPTGDGTWGETLLSTQANFGYSLTEDLTIAPRFGTAEEKATALANNTWVASVDKNVTTQELTGPASGIIYNDSLISFRNQAVSNTPLDLTSGKECGIIIMAQSAAASANGTYNTNFNNTVPLNYVKYFKSNSLTSGKLNATNYGEGYAYIIPVTSLSALNRVDIYKAFDYAKYSNGQFKVMAYYYNGEGASNSANYTVSSVTSGTLAPPALVAAP